MSRFASSLRVLPSIGKHSKTSARLLALLLFALTDAVSAPGANEEVESLTVVSAAAVSRPPVATFATSPFLSRPSLSPDGLAIAAEVRIDGRIHLGVLDLRGGSPPKLARLEEDLDVLWYDWAANGRVLVGLGMTRRLYGVDVYVTRLAVFDVGQQSLRYVGLEREGVDGDDVIFVDKDGKYVLLQLARAIGASPGVYAASLVDEEVQLVVEPRAPISRWFADVDGVVRAGIGYEGQKLRIVYRAGPKAAFETIAKVKLEDGNSEFQTIGFLASGRDLLAFFGPLLT